jgi:ceramide glucosyltransferase
VSLPAAVLALLLGACCLYYLIAILAALRREPRAGGGETPGVSLLKPVRGADPQFYDCIRSHADQDYPEFELLFAVRDPHDPAVNEIRRLAAEFPARRIEELLIDQDLGPNDKANGLERARRECRHNVLVINDSDIRVGPDYLRAIVAPLADREVGLVTCLYRGVPAGTLASLLESLWIATDFQVGVLVARLLRVQFALGATMAVRRRDIEQAGGFAPLAPYLADDYQLGKLIAGRGLRIALSDYVVDTVLPAESWRESWRHRLRWGRTLRVCRPSGYGGVLVTFAIPLAIAAVTAAPALWPLAAGAVALRLAAALLVGFIRLKDANVLRYFLLIPIGDALSLLIWAASLFGRKVVWRGTRFRLENDGRLTPSARSAARG